MNNNFDRIEDSKFYDKNPMVSTPVEYFEDRESATMRPDTWHKENLERFKFRVTMLIAKKYLNNSEMRLFKMFTFKTIATMWIKHPNDRDRLRVSFLNTISNFWNDEFDRRMDEHYYRVRLNDNRLLKQCDSDKFKSLCGELKILVDFFTSAGWKQADRKCREVLDLSNRSYGLKRYKFLKRFIYHRGHMKRVLVNYSRFSLQMAWGYMATILKTLDDYPECQPIIDLVNDLKKNKIIHKKD